MNVVIKKTQRNDGPVLYVRGEIDAYTAPQVSKQLLPLVTEAEAKNVSVDLRDVSYMDSTGVGVLIGALKASRQSGCQLVLENVTPRIERLFRITGLSEIIPVKPLGGEAKEWE
ncbi:anti-sigma factor antagonist [Brevibacillus marinus]|uniref:anti-sigma factor antagonist n=1 Tax=Brevibacillus marinus TaxID=2496837 RepID=UPI000F847E94|nr:anti-sigma factor antagonist [Brevibacillus marinus]